MNVRWLAVDAIADTNARMNLRPPACLVYEAPDGRHSSVDLLSGEPREHTGERARI